MEKTTIFHQQPHRALRLIAEQPALFLRQGSVEASFRRYGGRRLGPYFRLRYEEAGRCRRVYLGRDERLAAQVRQALAAIRCQADPLRFHRLLRKKIRLSMRLDKTALDARLRAFGLRLKGFELRGSRAARQMADLRTAWPDGGVPAQSE